MRSRRFDRINGPPACHTRQRLQLSEWLNGPVAEALRHGLDESSGQHRPVPELETQVSESPGRAPCPVINADGLSAVLTYAQARPAAVPLIDDRRELVPGSLILFVDDRRSTTG